MGAIRISSSRVFRAAAALVEPEQERSTAPAKQLCTA